MLTASLAAICVILAALLLLERLKHRREFARLESAISKQDRRLLGSEDYIRAPSHIRSLERAIFDQLFTTANLEKSVTRREELLAKLVDGLADAVLVTDRNNHIRFANENAVELLGLPENVTDKPIREAFTQKKLLKWLSRCHNEAISTQKTVRFSALELDQDTDHTFEVDIAPLQRNDHGGADVCRIVLHDITEREELERVPEGARLITVQCKIPAVVTRLR